MKKALGLFAVVLALGMTVVDAEAKRLGGARSSGMQRQQSTQPATPPTTQPNAPGAAAPAAGTAAAAAGGTAAAAAKRSWMGPVAGLAAGLGLMALASYLGFGEAMANMMLIALVIMVVLAAVAFFMRKRAAAGGTPAMAGAGMQRSPLGGSPLGGGSGSPLGGSRIGSALGGRTVDANQPSALPAGFDAPAFERNAKTQFMALQAANDAGDLQQLRDFLTPEMFGVVSEEIRERGGAKQATEVFGLEARVLAVAEEAGEYVVSVLFTGSVREQPGSVPEDLNEVWHLTKPQSGFGGWVVAGIQQAG
jgi:predicted lipid-binding transport protein (Tim44 family)